MRTFIAAPIPQKCLTMLAQLQRQLQASMAEVRWVRVPSIHLTLKFLGEVDQETISGLAEDLHRAADGLNAFHLRLTGLGTFPDFKNPRIVWCGIEGDTRALSALQRIVEDACSRFGMPSEDRPFRPHLTLGRVKGRKNLQPLLDRVRTGSNLECEFDADCFQLYKSVLKPEGPVYTVLETIALRRAPEAPIEL
jgi:2'-5' RNA ligase